MYFESGKLQTTNRSLGWLSEWLIRVIYDCTECTIYFLDHPLGKLHFDLFKYRDVSEKLPELKQIGNEINEIKNR